jgi:hypothetical protein
MHYSLSDGRVVIMDIESYFYYPDNIHQILLAEFDGEFITNPFHGSVLRKHSVLDEKEPPLLSTISLDEITVEDKFMEVGEDYFIED